MVVTGRQRNDGAALQAVIHDIQIPRPARRPGRPRTTTDSMKGDRPDRRITAVTPEKVDPVNARRHKETAGGQPPKMNQEAYDVHNVMEQSFNFFKQWRGLATRYDKLAMIYRATTVLSAIVSWVRTLGDTPWHSAPGHEIGHNTLATCS